MFCIVDSPTEIKNKAKKTSKSSTGSSISTAEIENIIDKLKSECVQGSTRKNYYSVWKTFNKFVIQLDVKPSNWEDRLSLFVGYLVSKNYQSQMVKSYISAIKGILLENNIDLSEDRFLLTSLTRACKLKNDRFCTKFPITRGMLDVIIRKTF